MLSEVNQISIIPSPRTGVAPLGVWIHGLESFSDKDALRHFVERLVSNGVDMLFPCVKQTTGVTDYPSSIAKQSDWSVGRDPLQELVEVAPEFGLKIHAWLCNFIEGTESALLNAHPELQTMQNHPSLGLQSDKPEMWAESYADACDDALFEQIAGEAMSCGAAGLTLFQYHALTDTKFAALHDGMAAGMAVR